MANCTGLGYVRHSEPSSIGTDTLIKSYRGGGNSFNTELMKFLINAGVQKELLQEIPRIALEVKYYTTFVGYGQPDVEFAEKLVNDLRGNGISCWLYSLDYTPGKRTWKEIKTRRSEADKMIILCSSNSLIRDGLLKELEEQIDEDPDKLIPVSLDNLWKQKGFKIIRANRDLKPWLMERNYADFSEPSKYDESFDRLLEALERKDH